VKLVLGTRPARRKRRAHFAPRHEILSENISASSSLLIKVSSTSMPAPDSPAPPRRLARRPFCTIASWVAPAVGTLVTFSAYQIAVVRRQGGDWLPGIGELLLGAIFMAVTAFGFGLAALLRRERNSWLAWLPFVSGLGVILYFTGNYLRNTLGAH
jgi:hypothetical protein